ncbi:hypothetical protein ACHAPQ_003313 [Fusarium lateritium]
MNWTEGALARHSRGKGWDKDAARQKQYFAKARARKHAPASSKGLDVTSFVPDYISQPQHSQERQSTNSTSSRKQRTPRRGLVYKQPEVANKSENNLPKDTSTRQGKGSAENEQTSNMHIDKDQQDLGIAEKRRRLLEKADWTGVITQKPALVDFSWRKEQSAKLPTKPVYDYRPGLTSRRSRQMDCPNSSGYGTNESSTKPGTDLVIPLRSQLPAIPNAPDLLDLLAAVEERHGVANDAPASREPTPDAEDEDEIWKKFVFDDDSIETSRKARQEAHEQTKRDLGLKKSNALLPFFESTLSSSSVAPPSDVAEPPSTLRNSSYLHKDSNHNETDDRAQDLREPSGAVQNKDIESTTDSVIAHPASPQPVHAEFKFHQPRLFVGRLANDAPCNPPSASLYDQPRKGRRPRKRREKERPDFRAIPNYNDDPIEED